MMGDEVKRVIDAISAVRFQPFLTACGDDPLHALRLYCWDGEAARAFLGPLRDLEVTMRNSFQGLLAGRFGRADWWNSPRVRLHMKGMHQIRAAEQDLTREYGPAFSPDDLVAKLTFGFWVGLLGRGHGENYESQFWYPALRHAFHEYRGRRGELQQQLDYARRFRNRVGHHERVFHRHLEQDYRTIIDLMRLLSPEMADLHEQFSQVPAVLARKHHVLSGAAPLRL